MDIGQSLNSRDSFPRRKFKNRTPISCSPGPVLSPPTINFELHAKTAEEIDLEKCTFCNFGSSVTLTLTSDRVEVTLVYICGQGLSTYQITWKSEKLCGRTDGRTRLQIEDLLGNRRGDDLTRKPRKGAAVIAASMHSFDNCRKFKCSVTLTLDGVTVTSTYTVHVGLAACPTT